MALRTYLPTLRYVTNKVCTYIGDHRVEIDQFIGEEHQAKVSAALAACAILVATLDIIIENPT